MGIAPDSTSPVKNVDRLAERVLAGLAPLRFETANTTAERDAVLRMRYDLVVELGWATANDYPDLRERDEYDANATFVVCRDGDALVGSARVIMSTAARPLPAEQEFRLAIRPPGETFEIGRIVVPRIYRPRRGHLLLVGLCARSWLEGRSLGGIRVVSTATSRAIDLYQSVGMRVTVLGPSQMYWGEDRVPIQIVGADENAGLLTRLAEPGSPTTPSTAENAKPVDRSTATPATAFRGDGRDGTTRPNDGETSTVVAP
jgi:N-acyl-L-homoserine lactone synthetase